METVTMKQLVETYVHNYGQQYESNEECIKNMQLRFYDRGTGIWEIDPKTLEKEGHIIVPENEWKNYNLPPYAIFYEEDRAEGKVYVKYIFHLNVF